jgi:hypothetical protein
MKAERQIWLTRHRCRFAAHGGRHRHVSKKGKGLKLDSKGIGLKEEEPDSYCGEQKELIVARYYSGFNEMCKPRGDDLLESCRFDQPAED